MRVLYTTEPFHASLLQRTPKVATEAPFPFFHNPWNTVHHVRDDPSQIGSNFPAYRAVLESFLQPSDSPDRYPPRYYKFLRFFHFLKVAKSLHSDRARTANRVHFYRFHRGEWAHFSVLSQSTQE